MTLDLATIPTDRIEASSDREQASDPANDPASEPPPEPAPLPAEPAPLPAGAANIAPNSAASPVPQELFTICPEPSAVYPRNHFLHSLYGGFMNMPDLPGAGARADLWDSFVDAYTSPDLRSLFDLLPFPSA
jgi:hypothetical protein